MGEQIFKGDASHIKEIIEILKTYNIDYTIKPEYRY